MVPMKVDKKINGLGKLLAIDKPTKWYPNMMLHKPAIIAAVSDSDSFVASVINYPLLNLKCTTNPPTRDVHRKRMKWETHVADIEHGEPSP